MSALTGSVEKSSSQMAVRSSGRNPLSWIYENPEIQSRLIASASAITASLMVNAVFISDEPAFNYQN
jgi:hypothetical protein